MTHCSPSPISPNLPLGTFRLIPGITVGGRTGAGSFAPLLAPEPCGGPAGAAEAVAEEVGACVSE